MQATVRWRNAVAIAALFAATYAHAQNTSGSRLQRSATEASIDAASDEQLAREWGLKAEEWSRYRQLMRGPLGIYSPNLDPLTALGIEARSEEERRHFARLQAQAEGRRAEKALAYQRAYDEAWRQLYPTLKPIAVPAERETATPAASEITSAQTRTAVFIKDNCPRCDDRVRQLQTAGNAFDIYMVGSQQDDKRIRQWAARVGIDPAKVKARLITLNHDSGRWLSIGGKGELPAVVTGEEGQWRHE